MDVLILLDKLDDLIYSSKPIPLTDQVRVEREEAYSLLDQIRVTLPEEIKQARWIVKERQEEQQQAPDRSHAAPAGREPSEGTHLQEIVDSIEELKRAQRPAPPPLTAAAAEKVRSIVEAAEASAAEVRAEAEQEARKITEEASRRAYEVRKRSAAEAEARLKRADEVTATLLSEAGEASKNIETLLDRVRGPAAALADVLGDGAGKVQADFDRMSARMGDEPVDAQRGTPANRAPTAARTTPAPVEAVDAGPGRIEGDAGDARDRDRHAAGVQNGAASELPGPRSEVTAGRGE